MLKRVKKLVKGHKKTKDKNVNALSFHTTTDQSNGQYGQSHIENKNRNSVPPSFQITDHSNNNNQTPTTIIVPPSIQITDHSSDNDALNNNDNDNDNVNDNDNDNTNNHTNNKLVSKTDNQGFRNQRCASSGALQEKNKKTSSKEKLFKKRKGSQQLQIPPEGLRQVSKSTGDLRHLLPPNGQSKTSRDTSRRGSVETVRENRLSVISKLDEYIDHFKKSVDEDKMAYAPNRLCCAQILLKVYQKREQQYIYNSLHSNRNSQPTGRRASHSHQPSLSPSSGSFHNLKNTSSTPNFVQGHQRRVSWQQGSTSSLSDNNSKECNFRIGGGGDTSDSDSDGHGHNDNESTDSNPSDIDFSNNNRSGNSLGILKSNMKQRSTSLFPHTNTNQNIEIY